MNHLCNRLGKTFLPVLLFILLSTPGKAQTALVAGDVAFSGYIANDAVPDQFSFVILKNITATTVIKFTDYGWRTNVGPAQFTNSGVLESEITFTATSALSAGQEITIVGTTATISGGPGSGTVVFSVGANFLVASNISLAGNGDQILAYQGTFASPVFIAGIHMNVNVFVNPGDPPTTTAAAWDGLVPVVFQSNNNSELPAGLTTYTNANWFNPEMDNVRFVCASTPINTVPLALAALNSGNVPANWIANNTNPCGFILPTGCNYLNILSSAPAFTLHPAPITVCEAGNTSFTITATGATSYQWQVDNGGGFANISNNATYSGATTVTLNITGATNSMNGYQYRCVATNGFGSTNSNPATLTVTALPVNPTLLLKTPSTGTVADGTPVSATFNPGSGGSGCTDDYRYTTDGGTVYTAYTPGNNISTTGVAAGSGFVFIEGRRAGCATCSGSYVVLASWVVTPLPAGATTLNAGDIGFTGYTSTSATDEFSFVLLRNIGPGTVINFTDNGWLSTNVFGVGESTATWTSNAAYPAGTEIKISGLIATLAAGGSAGTVTGVALSLLSTGDQVLAYRGLPATPTFISAIHMNVEAGSTNAAWDGAVVSGNASALPTGLTSGVNCIWIGTPGNLASEHNNAKYGLCGLPAVAGSIVALRASLNNQANWTVDDTTPPAFVLPTGCPYLGIVASPVVTVHPSAATVCELSNTSFSITATGATNYQWQVDNGGGFANVTNNANYTGATTATLNLIATPFSFNGYIYRCIASNGGGSATSNPATLTVTALPVSPTLLLKTPATVAVADGTPVSATFNGGSGGTGGCTDDFRYTTDGGTTYSVYTPGTNISTTGLAAGSGFVFIEGRRAGCATCSGSYTVLAAWRVTPIPVAATTLNAGDIAFSGYTSTSIPDEFSFVLLKNIGPGTVINFTDNGWLSTNVFGVGESTVTWTAPAGGLPGGTEIKISALTATRSGGGAAGTVTGTALSLLSTGDQVLAYRGTAASPTFISAIHMNVEVGSTNSAWDGAVVSGNASALPTGLTSGVNCIWIGLPGDFSSEHNNAKYGLCSLPAINGSLVALRLALNNQANWMVDDNTPPLFTLPTGCNYLSAICETISLTSAAGTDAQTVCNNTAITNITYATTIATGATITGLPTGVTGNWAGNVVTISGTPTTGGVFNYTVTLTGGTCGGITANGTISSNDVTGGTVAADQTITLGGDPAAFTQTVASTGNGALTYQWQSSTTSCGAGFSNIAGATSTTYDAPAGLLVTTYYRRVTTSTLNAVACTAISNCVTVTVTTVTGGTVAADQTICSGGDPAAFTETVASTGGGTLTYQWQSSTTDCTTGFSNIGGATSTTYDAPAGLLVTTYYRRVTTSSIGPSSANSNCLTVTVNNVTGGTVAADQTICSGGDPAAFTQTVASTGSGALTYQWQSSTVSCAAGFSNIAGATATTYDAPAGLLVTTYYRRVTTSTLNAVACTANSNCVTVTVNDVTGGTVAADQTICSGGDPAAFTQTVASTGSGALTYQWQSSTVSCAAGFSNIAGATATTYDAPAGLLITTYYRRVTTSTLNAVVCTANSNCTTVIVNPLPTITCPGNIALNNTIGQCGRVVTYSTTVTGIPSPTETYVFAGATIASGSGNGSGSFFNVGVTNVTVTATNICGSPSCSFTVTITDAEPPSITCPGPVTVSCASAVPVPNPGAVIASDNCPVVTVTHQGDVISGQTCANRYTITRTYRATDAATNFTECTQIITVNDVTPPTITCPANVTVSCAAAVPAVNIGSVTGVSDNCAGVVTITHQGDVISGQTCANRFTVTRTYRATDVCGNFTECTQIITVNDITPPVITCPAAVTVSCASAVPAVNTASVTATDNCAGVVTITHISDVISNQTCANRFTVTRTYRATDVCGNFAECTQIITVNDITPPTIICPAPVTVSCAAAVPAPNVGSVTGVSDNCAGVVTITHQGDVISAQTCANRFTVTRTYRATDVCGNFTECTQIITVNDITPPVITCPAAVTVSCASAVPAVNTASVTATDNCAGVVTITHISDVISNQTCANRFTVTRTYRATDVCGNIAQCTQIITVNDITAPVITCPANITATTPFGSCTAVVNFIPTATDNCSGTPTIVSVPASGFAFPIGPTTVTSTATDVCGNTSSCTFTVTVLDGQLPVITQQPTNRTVCVGANATFSLTAVTSPNTGGPLGYQWQQWNGSAWVNVSGATASSFTVSSTTLAMNTNTFRCVVTGLCTIINSGAATLFVNPLPTISIAAVTLNTLQPTQTTNVVATVNPAGGSFVWTRNGTNIGVSGPIVGPLTVDNLGTYLAVYTDPNGCQVTSSSLVISALASDNIWIYPNPNSGQFNVRYYNQSGESATIKVFNALGQLVYQKATATGTPYSLTTVTLPATIPNGVYEVKVLGASGKELAAKKIIVNKN
jgi:hypothetical protein